MEYFDLAPAAFWAGLLTFLAPCTLPLVPGYLAFISGVSFQDFADPTHHREVQRRVLLCSIFYVVGFSCVFILFGSLFGLLGFVFAPYRSTLARFGGAMITLFGLSLLGFNFPSVDAWDTSHWWGKLRQTLTPGRPLSAFVLGVTFAIAWTPCIGPVLGSVLFLASSSATATSGAFLLAVFSLGLAVPFLVLAVTVSSARRSIGVLTRIGPWLTRFSGAVLALLGLLLATGNFDVWIRYVYQALSFINYDGLLKYL